MTSPQFSILFSAPVSGTVGTGLPGTVLIPDATSGLYVVATTANRAGRRSTGIALANFMGGQSVEIQQMGRVDGSLLSTLGAGTASWVRCSATGTLERAAVSGSDDVVGYVEADGTFHAFFGMLTAAIVNGGGGGSVPTGNGFVHITAGAQDAAARAVDLSGADVGNTLPVTHGGTGITSLGAGMATWWGTPSGANLAAALTSPLSASKGGIGADASAFTGLLKFAAGVASCATLVNADVNAAAAIAVSKLAPSGTNGWVLTTTGGVPVWQAPSGGGASAGGAGQVQTSDGAGGFTAPTDVLAGADFVSIGATPSAALGLLRFPSTVNMIAGRNAANAADLVACSTDASDNLFLGADAATANAYSQVFVDPASFGYLRAAGTAHLLWGNGVLAIGGTIVGNSTPYSAHGGVVVTPPANVNYTLSSAEYSYDFIRVDKGAFLVAQAVIFPAPASMAAGYYKTIYNNTTFTLTITNGVGTTRTLATGNSQRFWFDNSGVLKAGALTAV